MTRAIVLLTSALLALTACAAPELEVFPSPDVTLAVRPSRIAEPSVEADPATPSATESTTSDASPSTSARPDLPPSDQAEPAGGPEPAVPAQPPSFVPVGAINDINADAGLEGPEWADLVGLTLADDGTTLRITVDFAAEIPAELDEEEVAGIGVDLLRAEEGESRYQVLVDGGSDGWRAYFQRQDGFIAYPGTFTISGRTMVLTLPAETIGNPVRGDWRSFIDWSGRGPVLRPVANDRAPDNGWATFDR